MAKILKPVSKISGIYGQPGEEKVSEHLAENLSDEYLVLNSPRIFYRGQVVDMDHVVIGPNGLFVVESKNMQGRVRGGLMGNWVQEKRAGGERVSIGNPANQISQYAKILRSFIADHYAEEFGETITPRVFPVVVFVHDQADLAGIHFTKPGLVGKVRVLHLNQLVEYITGHEDQGYEESLREKIAGVVVPPEQRDRTGFFNPVILREGKDQFLARYEITEEIGAGSFGSVYRGYDFKLEREVAVKKLHGALKNNPEAVKLFFREAQVAAKLQHENIVAVYDYYEEHGDYYLILEYVEGDPLDKFLAENKITLPEAAEIFESISSAVEEAHRQGVIHLDLKPGNVLITSERKVKVTDFGMAQMIEGRLFEEEGLRGTPSAMAPEQVERGPVDERTDIFALGIIAYMLVTGVHPFPGSHVGETVHKIVHLQPVSPRSLEPQLPEEGVEVIMKALAKKPAERFKSVSDLLEQWNAAMSPENLMYATVGGGSFLPIEIAGALGRFVPRPLKKVLGNPRKKFISIAVITALIFVGLILYQNYRDSRALNQGGIPGSQFYGFTNSSLKPVYKDPGRYKNIPVQLIGGVEKIVKISEDEILFSLKLEPSVNLPSPWVIISYRDPHFLITNSQFFQVSGAVAGEMMAMEARGEAVPVIIADKVKPIEDPWSVLAPSLYNVYVKKTLDHGGREVTLEKVEMSSTETRLFINIRNNTGGPAAFNLSSPRGIQGRRTYNELSEHYGGTLPKEFVVQPMGATTLVIFLEKMDIEANEATFMLGQNLASEEPYIFKVKW